MCSKRSESSKTGIFNSFVQRLVGRKTAQDLDKLETDKPVDLSQFAASSERSDITLPPKNRLVLDADRRYRHQGVDGWKIEGYAANGNILLTTDLYKHVELAELRALNPELTEADGPKIGSFYRIKRSNGDLETFQFQGVNPANKKLMMVKLEGHKISVSEEHLASENWGWKSVSRKTT